MGLGDIQENFNKLGKDEKAYNKFLMIKQLQDDVREELKVSDDVRNAFESKQKNGFENDFNKRLSKMNEMEQKKAKREKEKYEFNYYLEKTNAYLGKLKQKTAGQEGTIDVIIQSLAQVRDYIDFSFTPDGNLAVTSATVDNMEQIVRKEMEGVALKAGVAKFSRNADSNIFDNQNAIEAFDKLKTVFKAAKIDFDQMDLPEVKFLCHVTQAVKNSAQKAEILNAKLELQKTRDGIEELQAEDKKLIKGKAAFAIELSKNNLSIDTLEEQLTEKVNDVQQKYNEYKEKTDEEIERVANIRIKEFDDKFNAKKADVEKQLNDGKNRISTLSESTEKLRKDAENFQTTLNGIQESLTAYQNKVTERDNYERDIKEYIAALDEIQLEEVKLEDLNDKHDKAEKDYDYYINANLQDLEKQFMDDTIKLAQIQQTSELVTQNRQLHADADFVRKFDWKTAKAEEYQKFNNIFMDLYANSADEEMSEVNKAIKDLVEKGETAEQSFTFLKQGFAKKSDARSQYIADAYRNATNGKNINDIKADDLETLQKSISANQARYVAVKNMTPEQKNNIISAYEKSNTEITEKSNLLNTLKENKAKIFDKLKGKYEIGNGERKDIANAGKKYDDEIAAIQEKLPELESQRQSYDRSLRQTNKTISENEVQLKTLEERFAAKEKQLTEELNKLEKETAEKKQNIRQDPRVKRLIDKQMENLEKANKILENEKQRKQNYLDAVDDLSQKGLDNDLAKNNLFEGNPDDNVLGAVENYNRQFAWIDKGVNSELGKFQTRSNDAFDKSHNNTAFFREMIEAIDNAKTVFAKDSKATMEEKIEAMNNIKLKADSYLTEKKSQFRPFPSQMRKTRLQFAEDLKKYADSTMKDLEELKNSQIVKDVKEFIDKGPVDPEQIDYRENVKKDVSDLQQTEYVKNTAEKYINEKAAEKENKEMTDISIDFDRNNRNDKEMYPYEPEISFDGLYKDNFGPNI